MLLLLPRLVGLALLVSCLSSITGLAMPRAVQAASSAAGGEAEAAQAPAQADARPCAKGLSGAYQACGSESEPAASEQPAPTGTTGGGQGEKSTSRLLVVRTHRCASTQFGGWVLRAAHASRGRLEVYRSDDGEVPPIGVTAWADHANYVLDHRTVGPWPPDYKPFPAPVPHDAGGVMQDDAAEATLVVAFVRSPPSQFPSAYGSFKSSGMGYYGESVSDTLSRPPRPENWRLDNMNARALGWGPLANGAWNKELTPDQERRGAGLAPEAFVAQVEREIDLVLIVDHMVESMVILRRALGFKASALHNELAMLLGINGHLSKSRMSPDDVERVCSDTWSSVDCALFEHFNASLWAKVEAGGEELAEEVREVRRHWSTLDTCCADNSCARAEQIQACDRIHDSVERGREFPTIVQF